MSSPHPSDDLSDDDAILAAARDGFLEEADQLLQQFEDALLGLESDPQDSELLNAAFRAAHTVKGTAGLFGCDAVVSFTHGVETLMEALRSGDLAVSEPIFAALLASRDQMERLLTEVRHGRSRLDDCDPDIAAISHSLGQTLRTLMGKPAEAASVSTAPALAAAASGLVVWHLSLRFGADALRNGLDPLSFIRYLDTLGEVLHIATVCPDLPPLESLDPEGCHLGFDIRYASAASRATIEQVFDFVIDDCELSLVAEDAPAEETAAVTATPEPATAATPAPAPSPPPAPERRNSPADRRGDDTRYLRVSADKLDHLIDLIGELVIAGSGAELVAQRERSPAFMEAALRIHDLVQEARDGALSLRMVPIGETFSRFQRVVRDVSKALGKDVELQITGGDTEMDKSMVEAIADPLMHLVRNSLDHGIESSDDRAASGKSPRGRLALNAYHESGQIVIEVSDDGRGLARERILAKAIERELIAPDAQLSDAEVNHLIFAPGFSTADKVTDISGRGVGMDVVKRNIDALRGHIQIASTVGRGTTMQIRLPLTLAIIDGFLTSIGDVHYVVPLEGVVECIETPPACRAGHHGANGGPRLSGCFDLRGEVLPYVDLRTCFQLRSAPPARQSMLLVRTATSKVGLLVDRLLGEHQTVLKPLGRVFQQLPGIAGSTILGSGEVALVLDVPSLMTHVTPPVTRSGAHHPHPIH